MIYLEGLSEDTEYFIRLNADYGDATPVSSEVIWIKTGITVSSECDVTRTLSPPNGTIDHVTSEISNLRVANSFDSIVVNVEVSPKASWGLYPTKTANTPIADQKLTLREGRTTTVYIKTLAEDGYTSKTYSISIYRQSKSATPGISVTNGKINISAPAGSIILYTTDNSAPVPDKTIPLPLPRSMARSLGPLPRNQYSDIITYLIGTMQKTEIEELYFDTVGNGNYEYSFYIQGGGPLKGEFFVTAYSGDGKLIGMIKRGIDSSQPEIMLEGKLRISGTSAYYKAMMWNTLESLTPLAYYEQRY